MIPALDKLSFNRVVLDPFEESIFVPAFMSAAKNGSSSCVALETSRINDRRLFNYSTSATTSVYTKLTVNYSSVLYTLQDGYPRLNLIPTTTITNVYTTVRKIYQTYPTPHPNCDIRTELSCGKCTVHGGMDVQLIYWGNTNNNTKPSNRSAILTDASSVTAVLNGTTFTSPSLYLSYGKIGVYDKCGVDFLHTYTNVLVTLPPNALSSLEQDDKENIVTRSFNLGDLVDPVPASPYLHQITCAIVNNTNDCLPILPLSQYSPVVAVPSEIFSVDPYFKNCNLYFRGAWDPPRILVPANALGPTSAVDANLPTQAIKPGAFPTPFEPAVTADPQLTPSPLPKPESASNGDISNQFLPANKNQKATDPTLKNSPVSNDVSNGDLVSPVLLPASRTAPVVVEADPTLPSQIYDTNLAGVVTDHSSPVIFSSANAAPIPILKTPSTTLDNQAVVTDSALSQSLNLGKKLDVLTTPIPLASAIVTGGSTLPFLPVLKIEEPATNLPAAFTFGGRPIYPNSASEYIINDQTLIAGSPAITVSGTHLSIAPLASTVFIGTSPIPLLITSPPKLLPTLTIGDIAISPNAASKYIINGQTLIPGGPAITLSSTSISLAQDASALFIGTNVIPLTTPTPKPLPTLTLGELTITPNAASLYIINGQTLIPGGPAITLSSTRVSLAQDASAFIIGTNTIPLSLTTSSPPKPLPNLTIGDSIITPNAASQYIINSQTLIPGGPAITLSGSTRISLAPSASVLVVGTKTSTLFSFTTTEEIIPNSNQGEDLGVIILKGLGIQYTSTMAIVPATNTLTMPSNSSQSGFLANTTASGSAEVFRGDAASRQNRFSLFWTMIMLMLICFFVLYCTC